MHGSPNDINEYRKKKRSREGWTLEEIKRKAKEELRGYKEKTDSEPSDLASGDIEKLMKIERNKGRLTE